MTSNSYWKENLGAASLRLLIAMLCLTLFQPQLTSQTPGDRNSYYRLQLKHGGQYVDADHCTTTVGLSNQSDWENGACQLWRFVPAGGGWSRLQLQQGGQYLDADHCTAKIGLSNRSDWEDGACQLWRFVPAGGGWSRLQLKHGGQYLDADHCTTTLTLNSGSDWENGACQLWRLVPVASGVRID